MKKLILAFLAIAGICAAQPTTNISNLRLQGANNLVVSGATFGPAAGGTLTANAFSSGATFSTAMDLLGSTRGSILYRGASGWTILAPGTVGYVLTSAGAGADPYYAVGGGGGGGSGTVTSASVVTANGVSATVATATTTPAFTFTLGAITPSSVASSGAISGTTGTFSALTSGRVPIVSTAGLLADASTLTFSAGTLTATTFAGNLTGNVTGNTSGTSGSTTGNAATATALATVRTIGGSNFDGTANVTSLPVPGAIGGTTPAAGAFTTVTATGLTSGGVAIIGTGGLLGYDAGILYDATLNALTLGSLGVNTVGGTFTATLNDNNYYQTYLPIVTSAGSLMDYRTVNIEPTLTGSVAAAALRGVRIRPVYSASANITSLQGQTTTLVHSSANTVTTASILIGNIQMTSTGNITNFVGFGVNAASVSSSGDVVGDITGLQIDSGASRASAQQFMGVNVSNQTNGAAAGAALTMAYRGQMASGTGRYNLYMDGTAQNFLGGTLAVTTSLTTPSTTFALANTTATTVNAFGAATTVNTGAAATQIWNFGGSTTASEFRFLEPSGSGTNYSAFKAVAQAGNITYSLPPTAVAGGVWTDVAGNGVLTSVVPGGSLTSTQVGYGNGSNVLTGEAAFTYTAASNTMVVGAVSLGAGSEVSTIGPLVDAVDGTTPLNNINQVVAAGTAYTMTASYASLDFGTTDPVLTIANAGTYAIYVNVQFNLVGATYATYDSVTAKLRRTNNTAADLTGSTFGTFIPTITTITATGPYLSIGPIKYTTALTSDTLTVQAVLGSTPSVGSVTATAATITAIRMY